MIRPQIYSIKRELVSIARLPTVEQTELALSDWFNKHLIEIGRQTSISRRSIEDAAMDAESLRQHYMRAAFRQIGDQLYERKDRFSFLEQASFPYEEIQTIQVCVLTDGANYEPRTT